MLFGSFSKIWEDSETSSPLGVIFEMIILFFSVIRDLAVSIMRLDITSVVSSNERLFVSTCNMYKSGLKSLVGFGVIFHIDSF